MNVIRILHIVNSLKKGSGVIGVIMNYYRNIDRNRIQFDFLYYKEVNISYREEIQSLGGYTYKINIPSIKNILNYRKYLNKYIEANNFNYLIVHIHELISLSLIAPILKKHGVKHIIAHSHSAKYSFSPIKSLRNYFMCLKLKQKADRYCACSNASGEFWFGKEFSKKNLVSIINNAIDCDTFRYDSKIRSDVRSELNLGDSFVIGHVGRFSTEKNHMFIIKVFSEIVKVNPNSILILVGEGSMISKIKEKVRLYKLSKYVMFLGQRSDVNRLYQAMDAFIFPSISEGIGMVAIEAQCSGLPCVISDSVTKEVGIINTEFLPLKSSPKIWAEHILKSKGFNRLDNTEKLKENGFCIETESQKLLSYYEGMYNKNGNRE